MTMKISGERLRECDDNYKKVTQVGISFNGEKYIVNLCEKCKNDPFYRSGCVRPKNDTITISWGSESL